jgi:inner membrane protein
MDNITHGLLGYALHAATTDDKTKRNRYWYFAASVGGAEIPDIESFTVNLGYDVYLYWHRHITHSIPFSPIMALLTVALIYPFARRADLSWKRMFFLAWGSVFIHIVFDTLNTWGTGIWEPFVHKRYSLGYLPIVDAVILALIALGVLWQRKRGARRAFRLVWAAIGVYIVIQGVQNEWVSRVAADRFEQHVVAAEFVPGQFRVVGKTGNIVEIYQANVFAPGGIRGKEKETLVSVEDAAVLSQVLRDEDAKAIAWFAPFYVVTVKEDAKGKYGVLFDPRFYREGSSFLREEVALHP